MKKCPRCYSSNVGDAICYDCRIAYDKPSAFDEHTREYTMVTKRWQRWRSVDRAANERKRIDTFLGNG